MCLGDLVTDVVVRPAGPLRRGTDATAVVHARRGGSAANVAVHVVAAGGEARFVGCVGRDVAGDVLVADLARQSVEVCARRRGGSGTIVVIVDGDGERSFLTDRGACTALDRLPPGALAGAAALHLPAYSLDGEPLATTARRAAARARAAGLLVSVDTSSVAVLERVGVEAIAALAPDVVFANVEESEALGGPPALLAALARNGRARQGARGGAVGPGAPRPPRPAGQSPSRPPVVVVKAATPGGPTVAATEVWSSGRAAPAVVALRSPLAVVPDSTGAGDAFAAGFLVARTRGGGWRAAVAAGHRRAAAHLRSLGAR